MLGLRSSAHSDLDVFIVAKIRKDKGQSISQLSRLEEICLKADLIRVSERMDFRPFSKDGHYLIKYTVDDFVRSLERSPSRLNRGDFPNRPHSDS
jgi:hypothetical protein